MLVIILDHVSLSLFPVVEYDLLDSHLRDVDVARHRTFNLLSEIYKFSVEERLLASFDTLGDLSKRTGIHFDVRFELELKQLDCFKHFLGVRPIVSDPNRELLELNSHFHLAFEGHCLHHFVSQFWSLLFGPVLWIFRLGILIRFQLFHY